MSVVLYVLDRMTHSDALDTVFPPDCVEKRQRKPEASAFRHPDSVDHSPDRYLSLLGPVMSHLRWPFGVYVESCSFSTVVSLLH